MRHQFKVSKVARRRTCRTKVLKIGCVPEMTRTGKRCSTEQTIHHPFRRVAESRLTRSTVSDDSNAPDTELTRQTHDEHDQRGLGMYVMMRVEVGNVKTSRSHELNLSP